MMRQPPLERMATIILSLCSVLFVLGLSDEPMPIEPGRAEGGSAARRLADLLVVVQGEKATPAASIQVYCKDGDRYREVHQGVTDATGQLLAKGLPIGTCWLLGQAKGYARLARELMLRPGLQHARFQVELPQELKVKVVDELERPVARASVLLDVPSFLPHGALTSKDGSFTFKNLGPGPFRVRVYAQGFELEERENVAGDTKFVLRRLIKLHVRVVDAASKVVPNAEVLVMGTGLWPARALMTDQRGEAQLLGLTEGTFEVKATKREGSLVASRSTYVARGSDEVLELRLEPGVLLRVNVKDDADRPIAGAFIVASEAGLGFFPLRSRTDPSGFATLGPVRPGRVSLTAMAAGFVSSHGVEVDAPFPDPVSLRLSLGATVTGEVIGDRGFPILGASIEVVGDSPSGQPFADSPQTLGYERLHFLWSEEAPKSLIPVGELGVMPGPVPPIPALGRGAMPAGEGSEAAESAALVTPKAWVSDQEGRFEAMPVPPGRVLVIARHPEYVDAISEPFTLATGGKAHVVLKLEQGRALAGRVKDARGFAVAGARVEASALRGTLRRVAWTEIDGSFEFSALSKEVQLVVGRPEAPYQPALRELVAIPAGPRRHEVELVLENAREAVTFEIVSLSGEPIPLAQITVASVDPTLPLRKTLFTDERGLAELEDAQGREVQLTVTAPSFVTRRQASQVLNQRQRLQMEQAVRVEGEVRGVRGRVMVSGASVALESEGSWLSTKTDQDGRFSFDNAPFGQVRLEVRHPDHATLKKTVSVEMPDSRGRTVSLEPLVLEEGGRISGQVVDVEGRPVVGARVKLGDRPSLSLFRTKDTDEVSTDVEGRFELSGATPGVQKIVAWRSGIGAGQAAAEVRPGGTADVGRLILSEPDEGQPLLAASVAVDVGAAGNAVVVTQVVPGSEAARSGLQVGDELIRVNGELVRGVENARALLSGSDGTDVTLEISRAGSLSRYNVQRERLRR